MITRLNIPGLARQALSLTHLLADEFPDRLASFRSTADVRTVHTFRGHVLDGYFSTMVQRGFLATKRALAKRTDVLVGEPPTGKRCLTMPVEFSEVRKVA